MFKHKMSSNIKDLDVLFLIVKKYFYFSSIAWTRDFVKGTRRVTDDITS